MSMKQPGKKTYRTMQGKQIDMEMLRKKNELTPAIGNAKVNARGDELGAGGQIVRKREDIVNDYYTNTQSVPTGSSEGRRAKKAEPEAVVEEKEKNAPKKKTAAKSKTQPKEQEPSATEAEEWEEDDNGDFIKKGE